MLASVCSKRSQYLSTSFCERLWSILLFVYLPHHFLEIVLGKIECIHGIPHAIALSKHLSNTI